VNDPPTTVDDAFSTAEDVPLNVAAPGILANDTDVDGDHLTAVLVGTTTHGTLSLNVDGSFTYTPALNYNGPDSFTYRASDGSTLGNLATVSLTVTVVNDSPVAVGDSASTAEDTPLNVAAPGVLANDTDVEGNTLTAVLDHGPAHGMLTLNANGSYLYTPALNYNGPDSFTYRASDGNSLSNVATVALTVTAVNDAPAAVNDSYSTPQDMPLNVTAPGVLANDTDAEGDTLTAVLDNGPAHGTLTLKPDGSFLYTPALGYNGPDSFTYRASDGSAQSNVATVAITVIRPNTAPVAGDTVFSTTQGTPLSVAAPGVLKNTSDAEGDPFTAVRVAGPTNGLLTLNPDGSFHYTPAAGFHGTDKFTIRASDGRDLSQVATVTLLVSATNSAPVAHEDTYNATQGLTLTVAAPGVLANDTDVDGDAIFALLVSAPAHGALTLNADGSFVYTPAAGFAGADSFTYRASDVSAQSIPVLVTINVTPATPTVTAFGLAGNDTGVVGDGFTRNNTPGFTGGRPRATLSGCSSGGRGRASSSGSARWRPAPTARTPSSRTRWTTARTSSGSPRPVRERRLPRLRSRWVPWSSTGPRRGSRRSCSSHGTGGSSSASPRRSTA